MDEAASQTKEEANVVEAEGPPEKADGADESRDGAMPKQALEATEEKKAPQIQHSASGQALLPPAPSATGQDESSWRSWSWVAPSATGQDESWDDSQQQFKAQKMPKRGPNLNV